MAYVISCAYLLEVLTRLPQQNNEQMSMDPVFMSVVRSTLYMYFNRKFLNCLVQLGHVFVKTKIRSLAGYAKKC